MLEVKVNSENKKIISQIISLSKNILLKEPTHSKAFMHSFYAGREENSHFSSGIVIKWWYSVVGKNNLQGLADLIIQQHKNFYFEDENIIKSMVSQMFNEICINPTFFNFDLIFTQTKNTLLECRSNENIYEYGHSIYKELMRRLESLTTRWLNCYAAPRISGSSLVIEDAGIYLLNRKDNNEWKKLQSKGYYFNKWNPNVDKFGLTYENYEYVFISEQYGTIDGSLSKSVFDLTLFISLAYSFIAEDRNSIFSKCAAQPYDVMMQIPLEYGNGKTLSMKSVGSLIPYYIENHTVTDSMLLEIKKWFERFKSVDKELSAKVSKCGYFINKGMNNDGIDSFINYFISLDALFGVRGNVENSIFEGVKRLNIDSSWFKKIEYLYQLRNEFVHGGSREFKEWNKYRKYVNHFKTLPQHDLERLAFISLRKSIQI